MFIFPLRFICWSLNPPARLHLDTGPPRKKLRVNEVIKVGSWFNGSVLIRSDGEWPCEDATRRQLSASQEESPHYEPNWLEPWSTKSQPPELFLDKFLLDKLPRQKYYVIAAWVDWYREQEKILKWHIKLLKINIAILKICFRLCWQQSLFAPETPAQIIDHKVV
jgi:hypothetical protein